MRPSGSEVFGTSVMKTDEIILMASVMKKNGACSAKQINAEIIAIDDMLSMQRMGCIITNNRFTEKGRIRRNSALSDLISNRIDLLIEELSEL